MNAAAALYQRARVHLYHLAIGKTVLEDSHARQIRRVVEGRHDDTAIHEVEIDIARGERTAAPVLGYVLRLRNLDKLERTTARIARLRQESLQRANGGI